MFIMDEIVLLTLSTIMNGHTDFTVLVVGIWKRISCLHVLICIVDDYIAISYIP